jgi:hypothetical protein
MLTTIFLTIIFQIRTEFKMFVEHLGPARGTVVGNHCCIDGSIIITHYFTILEEALGTLLCPATMERLS